MSNYVKLKCFQCMATFEYKPFLFDSTKFCSQTCRNAYGNEALNLILKPFMVTSCGECDSPITEKAVADCGKCHNCQKTNEGDRN